MTEAAPHGEIRVGIGGWTFEPWRGSFYPDGLPQTRELEYASRQLTAIEINSTYHGSQRRSSFRKWHEQTPDNFIFSVKASRYATGRSLLAQAGESVERFFDSGVAELREKLGPIVWQFPPTKSFNPEDFEAFLNLLPNQVEGLRVRHVLEVRHPSFACEQYIALARKYRAATVFTDSPKFPSFADITGDLVYARLMRSSARMKDGYAPKALDTWSQHARTLAEGGLPPLPIIGEQPVKPKPRDVFIFFINGDKQRAPAAARALLSRLGFTGIR